MSSTSLYGLVEMLLVFGVILGWAVWQWWSVRKAHKDPSTHSQTEVVTDKSSTHTDPDSEQRRG